MVRPRAGSFFYTADEFASMRDSILQMKALGASGVVLGLLHPDHTVDVDRTRDLVRLARPVQVTFHRAFDETPDLSQALEDVITASCDRILTSGGQPDVLGGATTLAALVERASRRIVIAAGGGLRRTNAAAVARLTNAIHFHGSLRRKLSPSQTIIESEDVRDLIERLRNA
jgi:copper homeostasis protein